jgi:hypothetical protein
MRPGRGNSGRGRSYSLTQPAVPRSPAASSASSAGGQAAVGADQPKLSNAERIARTNQHHPNQMKHRPSQLERMGLTAPGEKWDAGIEREFSGVDADLLRQVRIPTPGSVAWPCRWLSFLQLGQFDVGAPGSSVMDRVMQKIPGDPSYRPVPMSAPTNKYPPPRAARAPAGRPRFDPTNLPISTTTAPAPAPDLPGACEYDASVNYDGVNSQTMASMTSSYQNGLGPEVFGRKGKQAVEIQMSACTGGPMVSRAPY